MQSPRLLWVTDISGLKKVFRKVLSQQQQAPSKRKKSSLVQECPDLQVAGEWKNKQGSVTVYLPLSNIFISVGHQPLATVGDMLTGQDRHWACFLVAILTFFLFWLAFLCACVYIYIYTHRAAGEWWARGLFQIGWVMGLSHKTRSCLNPFWKAAIQEAEGIPATGQTLLKFSGFIQR